MALHYYDPITNESRCQCAIVIYDSFGNYFGAFAEILAPRVLMLHERTYLSDRVDTQAMAEELCEQEHHKSLTRPRLRVEVKEIEVDFPDPIVLSAHEAFTYEPIHIPREDELPKDRGT